MSHNLIFMALHFAISKSKTVFCFSLWAMSLTNYVYCSVRELSSCDVSELHSNHMYILIE